MKKSVKKQTEEALNKCLENNNSHLIHTVFNGYVLNIEVRNYEIWYFAGDIKNILGTSGIKVDDDAEEHALMLDNGTATLPMLNNFGVYQHIAASNAECKKEFKEWFFHTLQKSINSTLRKMMSSAECASDMSMYQKVPNCVVCPVNELNPNENVGRDIAFYMLHRSFLYEKLYGNSLFSVEVIDELKRYIFD